MLLPEIQQRLEPLFQQYKGRILFAYCFGSTVTGQRSLDSDIDLAFYLAEQQYDLAFRLQLITDCMRVLKQNNVDVVLLNTLQNLVLADTILREGVVIYCADADRRLEYEVAVQHMAIDFLHQRNAVMGV